MVGPNMGCRNPWGIRGLKMGQMVDNSAILCYVHIKKEEK